MVRHKLANIEGLPDEELPKSLRVLRLNVRAVELKRAGDYDRADEDLRRILEIQPYDAVALKNLAVVALLKEEPQRAIDYLETVLNPVPHRDTSGHVRMVIDDPQLRHTGEVQKLLGRAYQMQGDLDAADEHFRLSRRIDPTDGEVLLLLAWNAEARGDRSAMAGYLRQFLREVPPGDRRRQFAERKLAEAESPPAPAAGPGQRSGH